LRTVSRIIKAFYRIRLCVKERKKAVKAEENEMSEEKTVEQEAREMGWRPKEEWNKDPDQWRTAEEFVERGKKVVPILNDRIHKLTDEISYLKNDMKMVLKLNQDQIQRATEEGYSRAEAEYKVQLQALNDKARKAVEDGDVDEYDRVEKAKKDLKKPEKQTVQPQNNEPSPEFKEWNKNNQWYTDNADLRQYADMLGHGIVTKNPNIPEKELFEAVEKEVKRVFAHVFTNQNRENAQSVEGGGSGGEQGGGKKKTWSDLPADAKKAYERQAKMLKQAGRDFTKDEYVKLYFEEEDK